MIRAELKHCETLEEFYKEIVSQQEEAHGKGYCSTHNAIMKYLPERIGSYRELGVMQGATAAAACLQNPGYVELIDIDLSEYVPFHHLFEEYCERKGIILRVRECNSTSEISVVSGDVDVLMIDSKHTPNHLRLELARHSDHVISKIIVHDTTKPNDALHKVLLEFCEENKDTWGLVERFVENQGHTVIGRKPKLDI